MKNSLKRGTFVAFLITAMLVNSVSYALAQERNYFPDVPAIHPQYDAIKFFADHQVVQGYPDGFFRPSKTLNRAEAAKIIFLITDDKRVRPLSQCYNDVFADQWFSRFVCFSSFINGYADGYFRPADRVNYGEAVKMMFAAFSGDYPRNPDRFKGPWYHQTIVRAKNDGLIHPDVMGDEPITRGEFLDLLYRFYAVYMDDSIVITNSTERPENKYDIYDGPIVGHSGHDDDDGDGDDGDGDDGDGDDGDGDDGDGDDGDGDDGDGDDDDDDNDNDNEEDDPQNAPIPETGDLIIPEENFKVAFFGDGALNDRYPTLLHMLVNQEVDMVMQVGDIVNASSPDYPQRWYDLMSPIMDTEGPFPYFYTLGDNDENEWFGNGGNAGWQELMQERFENLGLGYTGEPEELGIRSSFEYGGIFFGMMAPGSSTEFDTGNDLAFLGEQLSENNHLWEVCAWHKLIGTVDEEFYETCRENGAIITNGDRHNYRRTHMLSNMKDRVVADNTFPYDLRPGQTFMFNAGTGGKSLSDQSRCEPEGGQPYPIHQNCDEGYHAFYTMDSVYDYAGEEYIVRDIVETSSELSDPIQAGALIIEFHVDGNPRKAHAEYINAAGHLIEEFDIFNNRALPEAGPEPEPEPTGELILTPQNYKVAFIGDTGYDEELCAINEDGEYEDTYCDILQLIEDEGADLILHQGDLSYGGLETNRRWMANADNVLGHNFPYFFSLGNHDGGNLWFDEENGYRSILQEQFAEAGVNPDNIEAAGVRSSFAFNGLFISLLAPGESDAFDEIFGNTSDETEDNLHIYLDEQLSANDNYLWQICSWHKNMRESQIGGKGDDAGNWAVFEACRENGAIIAQAHEHSYQRTHVLSGMESLTVADNTDPLTIEPGQTFTFVSGTGGRSLRDQQRCEPGGGAPYSVEQNTCDEWAAIYTNETVYNFEGQEYVVQERIEAENDERYEGGALFIEFYVDGDPRKARGYFKNALGHTIDEFIIYNNKPDPEPATDDFVYAEGTDLMLDGEEFRFMGANVYGAANNEIYACGSYADGGNESEAFLRSIFENFQNNGMTVLRFWAFQAYTDNGTDFSTFDMLFEFANEYGIKVIPTLENQWDHCPGNIFKNSDWYADGYQFPYGEYEISYREYVRRMVTRYKDEPAILMWQMMNEAESDDAGALLDFTEDMARLIKSIDSNHMVNLGTMATGQPGTAGQNLINLHSLEDPQYGRLIDILEIHDYSHVEEAWPSSGSNSVSRAASVAIDLDIPFFIGEAGISVSEGRSHAERASLFDAKFKEFFDHGGAGYLIWRWSNNEYDEGCSTGHCFTVGDPLLNVIQNYP